MCAAGIRESSHHINLYIDHLNMSRPSPLNSAHGTPRAASPSFGISSSTVNQQHVPPRFTFFGKNHDDPNYQQGAPHPSSPYSTQTYNPNGFPPLHPHQAHQQPSLSHAYAAQAGTSMIAGSDMLEYAKNGITKEAEDKMRISAVVEDAEKLTKDFTLSKLRIYSKRDDQDDHEQNTQICEYRKTFKDAVEHFEGVHKDLEVQQENVKDRSANAAAVYSICN